MKRLALRVCAVTLFAAGWASNVNLAQAYSRFQSDPVAACEQGVQLFFDGHRDEALPLLETGFANRAEATFASPDDLGRCTLALGVIRYSMDDWTGALEAYGVALDAFRSSGNRGDEEDTLNNIGLAYRHLGRYAKALEAYQQSLGIAQELGDRDGEGIAHNNIGVIYDQQGHYDEALDRYQQSLAIAQELDDQAGVATTLHNIGLVYDDQERYAEALAIYQQALAIRHEVGDRAAEGETLIEIGHVYESQRSYTEALYAYEKALAIRHQVGDRVGEAGVLGKIGSVYDSQARYTEALDAYRQALSIWREVGDRAGEAPTLNNIGAIYSEQGRYLEALYACQQALAIIQELGNRSAEGVAFDVIGVIYSRQGHYVEALNAYQQSLGIRREVGDRQGEGHTLRNMAAVYFEQGRSAEALEAYRQSLVIARELGDRDGERATLTGIGPIYTRQGRYAEALETYQQALSIAREADNLVGEGLTLSILGATYSEQGRYTEALEMCLRALGVLREVGDRQGEGRTLNSIGTVYVDQGRYAEALDYLQQAMMIALEEQDRVGEGSALNNIGLVYAGQGRYAEALDMYQKALAIKREVGDRVGEGTTLNNIGLVHDSQGRYTEALDTYQQALAIAREVGNLAGESQILTNLGGTYHEQARYVEELEAYQQAIVIRIDMGDQAGVAHTLNNIGSVFLDQERYTEALEMYQRALVIEREVGVQVGEGTTLHNIGVLYAIQGRNAEALDALEQAMTVFESLRVVAGSEVGRAGFAARYMELYQEAAVLYHKESKDETAFFVSERGRARAFLDSLATGYVELTDNEAANLLAGEQETYAAWQTTAEALARARTQDEPDAALIAGLETQLAQTQKMHTDALAAIEMRGSQLAEIVPGRSAVLELSEVQELLDSETTLISYFVLGDEGALAFLITHDSFATIELPQATLENLLAEVANLYPLRTLDNPYPLPLRNLYDWLVAPLVSSIQTPRVGIIPHQLLNYVPFAALTDGRIYFGQTHTLFTVPSASALRFIQANAVGATGTYGIIFGNPETQEPDIQPLAHAAAEAVAVSRLLGTTAQTGPEASESYMRAGASGAGLVHLAAHGSYNTTNPLYSAIYLAPSGEQDGRLEVHEVYGLDLKASQLVVLSACQSNVGKLSAGDELVGMTRAFFFAGTPTVIASLWSVDDTATEELMVAFYRHWQAGESKAEALQAAQGELQKIHPSPFYWAAFVLNGDPGKAALAPDSAIGTPLAKGAKSSPLRDGPPAGSWAVGLVAFFLGGAALLIFMVRRARTRT